MQTPLIWIQFLGVLTAAYCVFNWLPTLLARSGFGPSAAAAGLAAFNFGGIAGALAGAALIGRVGSRILTISFAGLGALAALVAPYLLAPGAGPAFGVLFAAGAFVAGLQPLLFAVAAHVYPGAIRATGVGAALAVGRLGAIASSALGAMLIGYGAGGFFALIAGLMATVALALALLPDHAPPRANTKNQIRDGEL